MKSRFKLAWFFLAVLGACLRAEIPWDIDSLGRVPQIQWLDQTSKIHTLLYAGEPYKGHPTHVYAAYASPLTLGIDKEAAHKYPAVVLVHGGGGHAFPQWAELYAKHGYAAIAMDLAGNKNAGNKTERLPDGGPPQDDQTKFRLFDLPDKDQWSYHAVADVILAHSLVRSFPEVDAQRVGVTGISWGGYLTCIVSGVDQRFKCASPMYGCGFLADNSYWVATQYKDMSPDWKAKWTKLWDPSSYIGSANMPIFFVNGASDPFYPLDSYAKTMALVKSPHNVRIQLKMPHGHYFDQKETMLFMDHYLKGGVALPRVVKVENAGEELQARVESPTRIVSAQLNFTKGPHIENKTRAWESVALKVDNGRISGPKAPADAMVWFVSVTDEREAMVTSDLFVNREPSASAGSGNLGP
jgi:dienelactone hydrolase